VNEPSLVTNSALYCLPSTMHFCGAAANSRTGSAGLSAGGHAPVPYWKGPAGMLAVEVVGTALVGVVSAEVGLVAAGVSLSLPTNWNAIASSTARATTPAITARRRC
jgi:hypothetical protein